MGMADYALRASALSAAVLADSTVTDTRCLSISAGAVSAWHSGYAALRNTRVLGTSCGAQFDLYAATHDARIYVDAPTERSAILEGSGAVEALTAAPPFLPAAGSPRFAALRAVRSPPPCLCLAPCLLYTSPSPRD